jgi:hypothetical protein
MPPKPKEPESLEDVIKMLKGLSVQFSTFGTKLAPVDTMSKQLNNME